MTNAIEVEALSKRYLLGVESFGSLREAIAARLRRRERDDIVELWSLRDIDFAVAEGEAVGVIGRNGAGKTTLLKILSRITEPTEGVARMRGRVSALLEVGTGFHPELTGRENVFLNGAILGMTRRDIAARYAEIVEFSGVDRFMDTPIKRFSSGMYLRLAFSVAAHLEPDVLLVDEILAVGDAEFQRKCLGKMSRAERRGRTIVFVSHDLEAVSHLCSRAIWLDGGRIHASGPAADVIDAYLDAGVARAHEATFPERPTEPISLLRASLANDGSADGGALRRELPLAIELEFRLHEAVPSLNLAAYLISLKGVRVIDESWRPRGLAASRGEPGLYRARFVVPPILNVGDYTLGVWIGNAYEDIVDDEALLTFRLEGEVGHRAERVVNLSETRWEVAHD